MMLSILKFSFWTVFSPYSALQQNSQSIEIRQIDRNKFFDKIGHPFPKICYYITLLENLKFCPKISVSRKNDKIVNLNFFAKNNDLLGFLYIDFRLDFEFSRLQKVSIFNFFQFLIIMFLVKIIMIFGAKIQIIQVIFPLKNSQKSAY